MGAYSIITKVDIDGIERRLARTPQGTIHRHGADKKKLHHKKRIHRPGPLANSYSFSLVSEKFDDYCCPPYRFQVKGQR